MFKQFRKKINDGKETSLKKFGCISPSQTTEVKRKISDSLKVNSEIRKINQKETWKRTLGVDNPMKLQRCKEKSDDTKRKNDSYGKSREEEDLLYEILKKYSKELLLSFLDLDYIKSNYLNIPIKITINNETNKIHILIEH